MIPYPPRLPLARLPTPLEPLRRASAALGVEILVKRDDLTGSVETGNKIRKLELLCAEAVATGADVLLTCGGAQSNHARATALAAARLGLGARLFLRVPDPSSPPPLQANLLLDRLAGAEIVWISREQYRQRAAIMAAAAGELAAAGRRPYVIPEGGSNALGAWGYVRAVEELAADLAGRPATVIYAAGSGGTGAGLIAGVALLGLDLRVVGVNVCDDRATFVAAIGGIVEELARAWGLELDFERERDVEILDGYVGRGYAESRPEELRDLAELARTEGVVLDPVYTGKAWHGMASELRRDPRAFGERIVFLHTGGVFGLFPKAAELAPLL
jgi:D-cysteine desulfhydrase